MSQLLVQFTHLFKSFGSISLFEDLSLSINQGDVFALIGALLRNASASVTSFL